MKTRTLVGACLGLLCGGAAGADTRKLELTDPAWELKGDARVQSLDGRTALQAGSGTAYRRDVKLADGTIDFDVRLTGDRAFAYVQFRMQSDRDFEEVYLRPHKSRLPDALQYAPVYQGQSCWQLYHGRDATGFAAFPAHTWIHVRIVLQGQRAAVFVGDVREPQLLVGRLVREARPGYVALRSFADGNAATPPVAFANVEVRTDVAYDFASAKPPAPRPSGIVERWRVAPAFVPGDGPVRSMPAAAPDSAAWKPVDAEPEGVVILGKHLTLPDGARRVATAAGLTLRAERAGVRRLDLGFSDEASVFLNGQLLYSGSFRYSFNFPRQEGLITLDQASLYLPLRAGDNELVVVVSEVFGGWGLMGRIEDRQGLEIR